MKTLIIYSTKYGCTEKAANILKSNLQDEVSLINIMKEKVNDLELFDLIILGGSIYMGKVQKELVNLITANLDMLLKKRIGIFICAGSPDLTAREKELKDSFPAELYNHAVCKEVFGSELNYEKMGFLDKMIMKAIRGSKDNFSDLSEEKIKEFAKKCR